MKKNTASDIQPKYKAGLLSDAVCKAALLSQSNVNKAGGGVGGLEKGGAGAGFIAGQTASGGSQ